MHRSGKHQRSVLKRREAEQGRMAGHISLAREVIGTKWGAHSIPSCAG